MTIATILGALGAVLSFVILLAVLWFCIWLFDRAILPIIPAKWLKYVYAIIAAFIIIYLLGRFFSFRI